jgi:hypothetical protein
MIDFLTALDRLIAKHPGGTGEGLRMAREAYIGTHIVVEHDPETGCDGGDYGDLCKLRYYAGGEHGCAVTGERTSRPAPASCPLRTKVVVVRREGGDRG